MKHSISYDDWLAYADGSLESGRTEYIETHTRHCEECRQTRDDVLRATEALRIASSSMRRNAELTEQAIRRGRERVLERIRAFNGRISLESAEPDATLARLKRLQVLVAPVCGAKTAFRLILAAISRVPITAVEEVDADLWIRFLRELMCLTSAFCGRTTARLVFEYDRSLEWDAT